VAELVRTPQSPEDFYRGKTVNLPDWPQPGGAYDASARLLGRHRVRAQDFSNGLTCRAYRWGHRKAERLGGLEVHGHLEFCRKLHREIARLGAA
jgi:hypothetical protein